MDSRYIRQTLLKEIGPLGQEKLLRSRIAIVGCGGLGSIVAPYLAGAGVGNLCLIDGDLPHVSNLHRQVFFPSQSSDTKAELLANHIHRLNPDVKVRVVNEMLKKENIQDTINKVDLVIECTDDMMCKYLVNDYCHLNQIPLVYGAIYKFEGYVSLFENKDTSSIHLRDAFPKPDTSIPTCSEVGVLGTIAGIIGLFQANEALKYIVGLETLSNTLLTYDCLGNTQFKLRLKKTFSSDMHALFEQEDYLAVSCETVPEISLETLLKERTDYELVSILEDIEHEDIDNTTFHSPLSVFPKEEWLQSYQDHPRKVVFYCQSGKRSTQLVSQLLDMDSNLKIYSLNGGLRRFKDAH